MGRHAPHAISLASLLVAATLVLGILAPFGAAQEPFPVLAAPPLPTPTPRPCPGSMPFLCWDGSCADDIAKCPCPPQAPARCPDGACATDAASCAPHAGGPTALPPAPPRPSAPAPCPPSAPFLCWDGSCKVSFSECPCPPQAPIRCPDGGCATDPASCGTHAGGPASCAPPAFTCWDGTCAGSPDQCPCPASMPYRCPAGMCVSDPSACPEQRTCPAGSVVCWDSTCKPSDKECPCPAMAQFRCPDGLCATDAGACAGACPPDIPVRCFDGGCAKDVTACPCPPGSVTCWDGSCKGSPEECPCPPQVPIRCSNGFCAEDEGACSCPAGAMKCWDGTCAASVAECPCPTQAPFRCPESQLCVASSSACGPQPSATPTPPALPPQNHITNPGFEQGSDGWEVKLEGAFDAQWCAFADGTESKALRAGEELHDGSGDVVPIEGSQYLASWACSIGPSSISYHQRLGMVPGLLDDLGFSLYDTYPETDTCDCWMWSLAAQLDLMDADGNLLHTLTYGLTNDDYDFPPITASAMTRLAKPALTIEGSKWKQYRLKPAKDLEGAGVDLGRVKLVDIRFLTRGFNANWYLFLDDVYLGTGLAAPVAPVTVAPAAPPPPHDPNADDDGDCIPNGEDSCPAVDGITAEKGCPLDEGRFELATAGPGVDRARFEWRYAREYKVYAKTFSVAVTRGPTPRIDGKEAIALEAFDYAWHTVDVGPFDPFKTGEECLDLSVTFTSDEPLWAADTSSLGACWTVDGKSQGEVPYALVLPAEAAVLRLSGQTGYDPVTIHVSVADPSGAVVAEKDVSKGVVFDGRNVAPGAWLLNLANTYRGDCDKLLRVESSYPVLLSASPEGAVVYKERALAAGEGGMGSVLLATTINYPDAIVAGAVAQKLAIPVLLTPPDALPEDVAAFLRDERPGTVIIAGGTAVVSKAIEDGLAADGFKTVRLWGITQYGTAAELALYAWSAGASEAIVAHDRVSDAEGDEHMLLTMAKSLAAARTAPVLLTDESELEAATLDALKELGVRKVTLIGKRFDPRVMAALDGLGIATELVTGRTTEEINGKLRDEVVDELRRTVPEGEVTRLLVVAAGEQDFRASISLPADAGATASMVVTGEERIGEVVEFVKENGIKEVTVVGVPTLTASLVSQLLLVEGIQVKALSTTNIEQGLVERLKERKDEWREQRDEQRVERRRELIRGCRMMRERTERAVALAEGVVSDVGAALAELEQQELPEELAPVVDMFRTELGAATSLVDEARRSVESAKGSASGDEDACTEEEARAYADALALLKKAESVARDAKWRGMGMIADAERQRRERVRVERDAMADDIMKGIGAKEELGRRLADKEERFKALGEKLRDRGIRTPGEPKRFGPSLEGRSVGPSVGRDLGRRRIGKDLTLKGDSCKRCVRECMQEEAGAECAFVCADPCQRSPCDVCRDYCPEESPVPEMCGPVCDEVCAVSEDVADLKGLPEPEAEEGAEGEAAGGAVCCQPPYRVRGKACIVDSEGACPAGFRVLAGERVDPFDERNCIAQEGDLAPRCEDVPAEGMGRPSEGAVAEPTEPGTGSPRWLPPKDQPSDPQRYCPDCMKRCIGEGKGPECGFVCAPVCGGDACAMCKKWCRLEGVPDERCSAECEPACSEGADGDGFEAGNQCDRCVKDCGQETRDLAKCSKTCAPTCNIEPCGVCKRSCEAAPDREACAMACVPLCGGAEPPPRDDALGRCREKCRGQTLSECMPACLKGAGGRPGPAAEPPRPALPPPPEEGPGDIERCRSKCSASGDMRGCISSCLKQGSGVPGMAGGAGPGGGVGAGERVTWACERCKQDCPANNPKPELCGAICDAVCSGQRDPCTACHGECDRSASGARSCHAVCDRGPCGGGGGMDPCGRCRMACDGSDASPSECDLRCRPECERSHPPMQPPGGEDTLQMPPRPPAGDACGNCFYDCEFVGHKGGGVCGPKCAPICEQQMGRPGGPGMPRFGPQPPGGGPGMPPTGSGGPMPPGGTNPAGDVDPGAWQPQPSKLGPGGGVPEMPAGPGGTNPVGESNPQPSP